MSLQDKKQGGSSHPHFQSSSSPPPPSLPLPPPPIIASAKSGVSRSNAGSKTKLASSPLPPPPKLALKGFGVGVGVGGASSKISGSGGASLPPPPRIVSRQSQQQQQQQPHEDKVKGKDNEALIHSTQEQIPALSSAPPSTGSLHALDSASGRHDALSPPTEPAPSTGTSWSSFTHSASGLLERAGKLAYTTVESAADLASDFLLEVPNGHAGELEEGDNDLLVGKSSSSLWEEDHGAMGRHRYQQPSGEKPTRIEPQTQPEIAFRHLHETNPNNFNDNSPSQHLNIDMSSPVMPPTKTFALPTTINNDNNNNNNNKFPTLPTEYTTQPKQKRRAHSNPPQTTLAPRQSLLKVLLLPTADAQTIATKNNTTLCSMFRIYGNHHRNPNDPHRTNDAYCPPLPPFRSAHRSMMLSWENLMLDFISSTEMEKQPVSSGVAELALAEASRSWDEDGGVDRDAELERLEECVADALAEAEVEERMRRRDGVASMSSWVPRRGVLPYGGEGGEGEEGEFRREEENEALHSCADAAFALTSLPNAPWLLRFRHTLDRSTDGMIHEMLGNPSVVILVASTSENFLICFAELANVHHLPRPYHDGRYDPNGLRREFLLLHDAVNGPKNFDEAKALSQMKERFGPGCCSVLRVNSLVPESDLLNDIVVEEDEQWEMAEPCSPFEENKISETFKASLVNIAKPPIRGACLSDADKRAIRRYVANMVATGLVPAVERRIANLNAAVSNAKRGVKNVIKSLWRKPKESLLTNVTGYSDNQKESNNSNEHGSGGLIKYRFDSIESQTRLLADTLFLMRDYDAALGVYRLVKDDYKHDKATLYYASVQEMILLCMHMLDPYGDGRFAADVFHSIETALYSYTRAADDEREPDNGSGVRPGEAPYATRLATRLCLVLSSTRTLTQGRHMEIADLLASASSHETPLGAAVLLEQSSAHYYRAGMLRKFAFHMLMAGHMFRSAGQDRHAFRCFSASLYVYHGERWDELRSHLHTALAAQLFGMGQFALSMQFYAKLISAGGGRVSVRSQQKFLNHIVDICRDHQSSAIIAVDRMNTFSNDNSDAGGRVNIRDILNGIIGAARNIEISNLGFPRVDDSSITVYVENTRDSCMSIGRSDSLPSKDTISQTNTKGDDAVWQDMINCAEAELRASAMSSAPKFIENSNNDGGPVQVPVHSGDETIDRVIMEIDKQERDAEYRERQKRKGKGGTPEVRATSEPIAVSFSLCNPLGLDIDLTQVQIVASLDCQKTGILQSNEFAVSDSGSESFKPNKVIFYGSEKEYQSPEFMCQLATDSDFSSRVTALVHNSDPYFVVTKLAVKARANTETAVSLNICPLVEGDLKILGFRFKLLDDVWVFHRFELLGPLLQDTQVNKARRARGESQVLRSKVEQKMPFLKVSITPDSSLQGTVLQGQTSHWKLKLSNLGYAPASNIMLKTNAPWLNIYDSGEGKIHSEDAPTSFCIGPSGTLMQVPFKGVLGHLGVLQPGETTEVPVIIRTSGGGRQDFYMLFRYELWSEDNISSNLAPRHRWTRELLSIPVYPSITMSASLMPSYSNKGEHILSIELMNYRSDRDTDLEINLRNVCIASRNFRVQQMEGQVQPESRSKLPSLQIGWQERMTLHYLVVPTQTSNTFSTLSTLASSKNDSINSENHLKSNDSTHVIDFMCRERAHEVFSEKLRNHRVEKERLLAEQEKRGQPRHVAQIRRARTSLPKDESETSASIGVQSTFASGAHPTSITSLCPQDGTSNINIICCWSALVGNEGEDKTVFGQHHLRNLLVRPQTKSKGCPLALTAKHKTRVSHKFEACPLDIDLEVTIRNRLVGADVEFEFSLDHQRSFDFLGTSSFTWKLAGGDEINVPLKARIYSGGMYNLQSVRLTIIKGDSLVPYLFPLQWTVMVEEV